MSTSTSAYSITLDHNVPIPMRDGTLLRADVYRPDADGQWPVILMRFLEYPINESFVEVGKYFVQHGYAFVYNDVRGCARSDGDFFPLIDEAWGENQDGYDTIEWAGHQPWSNGSVGLIGTSYGAFNQYTTAVTRPPSLKACIPFFGSSAREIVFPGGIYRLEEHRSWALWMGLNCLDNQVAPEDRERVAARLYAGREDRDPWCWHLPIAECPQLEGVSPWHFEHLKHQTDLDWWMRTDARTKFDEIDVPILHMAGWYDIYPDGMLEHFTGLRAQGRTQCCRNSQRIIVGPWAHGTFDPPPLPATLDFGDVGSLDVRETMLRWFDHWLKDASNGVADEPAVRLFLTGENRWLEMDAWPPDGTIETPIYLRQGTGRTDASLNNGHLTFETPITDEQPDTFSYDPEKPIIGHQPAVSTFDPDYRNREGQLLTYTSETLRESVVVVGPVKAVIYASSSARDTDWVVRLCDVRPDGRSIVVCDGMIRARFRNSQEKEELLEPGRVYRYEIEMTATAQAFLPGHRIRIHVTSSDFPEYDRNLNTGGPFGAEIEGQVAINSVFHDRDRPSHVVLPIVPDCPR